MKFRSTRLKTMIEMNSITTINAKLYRSPPQESDPLPKTPYLKASKIGVNGLSSKDQRYLSPAALKWYMIWVAYMISWSQKLTRCFKSRYFDVKDETIRPHDMAWNASISTRTGKRKAAAFKDKLTPADA